MSTHTPGPWEAWPHDRNRRPDYLCGVSAEGRKPCDVADVIRFPGAGGEAESEANAKLIASAPDLLAALERLLEGDCPYVCDADSCECGENGDGTDDKGNVCEHIQARRALAKAKGG